MTDKQPEALMYADKLEKVFGLIEYADEMRRLHEVNAELIRVLGIAYDRLPDSDEFDCIAAAVDNAEGK